MSISPLVEIRVPTYKRPAWLRRTLKSIQDQTEENWKTIVLDDSPQQEAKGVVEALNDSRISYESNPERLGETGNTDRAFESGSFTGASYAAVLQDTDTLLPDFLKANLSAIEVHNVPLILRNQQIWLQHTTTEEDTGRTTYGNRFEAKVYQPLEFLAFLFLSNGIRNGGLFWKTNSDINLKVGPAVTHPDLQELCRTLQIDQPLKFEAEPLSILNQKADVKDSRPQPNRRTYNRGKQSVMRFLINKYGGTIIDEAYAIAARLDKIRDLESALIMSGYYPRKPFHLSTGERLKTAFQSTLKFRWVNDPLAGYF